MLIKAEKILTHDDILLDNSETEAYERAELAHKLTELMVEKGLVKTECRHEFTPSDGLITILRMSVRAYNPDD